MEKQDFERIYEQWREQRIADFDALDQLLRSAESRASLDERLLSILWKIQDIVTGMRAANGKMFLAQEVTESNLKEEYRAPPDLDL